jgi:hypothetical protein
MSSLTLKRATASRSTGEWSDDDFRVLAEGEAVGRIMKVYAAPESGVRPPQGPHPNARLRAGARGRHGRVRQELAKGRKSAWTERWRLRFRTIQASPKDLPVLPRQAEPAVSWHRGFRCSEASCHSSG